MPLHFVLRACLTRPRLPQEAAARLALLREDADVKLLDGVAVSLVDRPAHRARLCDWLLDLSHTLLALDDAHSAAAGSPAAAASERDDEPAVSGVGFGTAVRGGRPSASLVWVHGGDARVSTAEAARQWIRRHRSAADHAATLAQAPAADVGGDKRFRYFLEKVCKIQVGRRRPLDSCRALPR